MHAQPSSGTMRLDFGPGVGSNAACLSRLLHIDDKIICLWGQMLCKWVRSLADMFKCFMDSDF